jgi:two-component system OmpR family sensor kinase
MASVSTDALQRYIQSGGLAIYDGPDPRDPDHPKIFSAAVVEGESGRLGYIYVILGNEQYRSVTQMLMNSRVTPMVLGAVMFILALSSVDNGAGILTDGGGALRR